MSWKNVLLGCVLLPLGACHAAAPTADLLAPDYAAASGLERKLIPAEDPGPPLYARATTTMNELFHDNEWLAIPFYREPTCVPPAFNLVDLFDFPGPQGPGAFGCPLVVNGALLIEREATLGTFPRQVVLTGNAVPIWFVRWQEFQQAAADGIVTVNDLRGMTRLVGSASNFHETLMPRTEQHRIEIEATGALEDGRPFSFGVVHVGDQMKSLRIRIGG